MASTAIEEYIAGFEARCQVVRRPGQTVVDEPGVRGLLPCAADAYARLLVTDDRAHTALAALLPELPAGLVNVLDSAPRCGELVREFGAWSPGRATAMVCRDLNGLPAAALTDALTVRSVNRSSDPAAPGVPLERAVPLAAPPSESGLTRFLRNLSPEFRLFAALDEGGAVRATSGSAVFADHATVLFVNTDPGWRRRGIGEAMTALALRDARSRGATRASLDSSTVGLSIYRRLGFEPIDGTTHFFRAP